MKEYIEAYLYDVFVKYKYYTRNKKLTYEDYRQCDYDYELLHKASIIVIDNYPLLKKTYEYYKNNINNSNKNNKIDYIMGSHIHTFIKNQLIYDYEDYFNILLRKEKIANLKRKK